MFEVLLFLAMLVAIGHLWSRMREVEQRLIQVEGVTPFHWPAVSEPEPVREERVAAGNFRAAAWAAARIEQEIEAPLRKPEQWSDFVGEPVPAQDPGPLGPEPREAGFGFEELFGRRLPIWAGGVTLAVAGVLIVRYSIEAGLLSPLVRFLSGLLFGAGLVTAAEVALRLEHRVRDPRVRQALAGAGIASLDASILLAVNLYGLISPMTALIGMAAITALAMALSLRFGAPSALLGLVGGLAAPALVGAGPANVPLLTLYLAITVGGLSALSRVQGWAWLGVAALVGGLGWGAALLLGGALDTASTISVGCYLLLVGSAFPLLAWPGNNGRMVRLAESVAGTAQMAALVATGDFALLNWALFGLISIATVWQTRREDGTRYLPLIGFVMTMLLLGVWPDPAPGEFALVLVATGLIYGGPLLLGLWRPAGSIVEALQLAALALAGTVLASLHFYRADGSANFALAALALVAACVPALAALLGWREPHRREDPRFALLTGSSALLVAIAAAYAAPIWSLPLLIGGIGVTLLLLSFAAEDELVDLMAYAFAAASVPLLAGAPMFAAEWERLIGLPAGLLAPVTTEALLRWAGLACIAALFAWRARLDATRVIAQAVAALLAYGAAAQLLPATVLPLVPSLALLAFAAASRRVQPGALLPALTTTLALVACWAALPVSAWIAVTLLSLVGDLVFAGELPPIQDVLLRLLVPAALIVTALRIAGERVSTEARTTGMAVAPVLAALGAHVLYKQLFAIGSAEAFTSLGLAERTTWEALLALAGAAAWKLGNRPVAIALGLTTLAHFGLFTLLLHNPLWAVQAVGSIPVFNLLAPSYGLALALLWAARRFEPEFFARFERARAILQMLLVALLAFSLLRQAAEGTILSAPGLSEAEDISRSILAILLATGFLLWGTRTGSRNWRIASLLLMLGAVAKVFLLDASGLEGLMRIASFVALGVSLIGIGWLYSRSLGELRPLPSLR